MPELPEVETVCRGIRPHVITHTITRVIVRDFRLRWRIAANIAVQLKQQRIHQLERRGKYLLFQLDNGTLIYHLGMSGRLYLVPPRQAINKHDHIDIYLSNNTCLRYTDPRRFGACIWTPAPPEQHPLLARLGVEPLTAAFNARYLFNAIHNSRRDIKAILMDSHVVTGIGNIYANEALFMARVHPAQTGSALDQKACQRLVSALKKVLTAAITAGGTTLRDFVNGDGKPGYFKQQLSVYGREGKPCIHCQTPLTEIRQHQRSTVYCAQCQR